MSSLSSRLSRRKPWLAAVLNVVWPGVGHLYAGRGRLALVLLLLAPVAGTVISLLPFIIPVPVANILVPAVLAVALLALFAWDAARAAAKLNPDGRTPAFSRWYVCLAAVVLGGGLNLLLGPAAYAKAYRCQGQAMEPTLLAGDRVWVAKAANGWRAVASVDPGQPRRGDVVVFHYPRDHSVVFVKRLVGLPNETVELRGVRVLIDGAPLSEPYARFSSDASARESWGPEVVPGANYFVLGDNRDASNDSRVYGFISRQELIGRAAVVYWSSDPQDGRVRWGRIGSRVK